MCSHKLPISDAPSTAALTGAAVYATDNADQPPRITASALKIAANMVGEILMVIIAANQFLMA